MIFCVSVRIPVFLCLIGREPRYTNKKQEYYEKCLSTLLNNHLGIEAENLNPFFIYLI